METSRKIGIIKLILGTLAGTFFFIVPLNIDGSLVILFTYIGLSLIDIIAYVPLIGLLLTTSSFIGGLYFSYINKDSKNIKLKDIFEATPGTLFIRIFASIIILLVYFNLGPSYLTDENTGGLIVLSLMPQIVVFLFLAVALMPLLLEYGAMELLGGIVKPIFRPLFKLPETSAILVLGAWVGSGTVGIISAASQCKKRMLTQKEASIIIFGFCTIALPPTFAYTTIFGGLDSSYFTMFYLTVIFCTVVSTVIIARIPTISTKSETYEHFGDIETEEEEITHQVGIDAAIKRAANAPMPKEMIRKAINLYIPMAVEAIPVIVVIATVALIIGEYTPLFSILSKPMLPVLNLIGMPEAESAAAGFIVGFFDLLLPFFLAGTLTSQLAKFVVCAVGVIQVICLSETGIIALKSNIGINTFDLVFVVFIKTIITIPIALIIGRLIGLS